jgi:hypothetical protein
MIDSPAMTPEEEVKRLNRLIRQYETVYRTTPDADQRERAARQLKEMKSYRAKILAVNEIDRGQVEEQAPAADDLASFPVLRGLAAADRSGIEDLEIARIILYVRHFESEYLPLLTEKQLKLDFKFSMDRDSFYRRFQGLDRRIKDYLDERRRLEEGVFSKDMETEFRKRGFKLKRVIAVEECRLFRALSRFAKELVEDASGDGVKCLNADREIAFDEIEGKKALEGRTVVEGLQLLADLADEAVSYLNIPEIETQENERADRY